VLHLAGRSQIGKQVEAVREFPVSVRDAK
jgi:hypothetical protein